MAFERIWHKSYASGVPPEWARFSGTSFERIWHKSYPAGVPGELKFDETVMPEILTKTTGRFPDRDALIFMGTKITYRDLDAMVNRLENPSPGTPGSGCKETRRQGVR